MKTKTDFVDYNGTVHNKTTYVGNTYPCIMTYCQKEDFNV